MATPCNDRRSSVFRRAAGVGLGAFIIWQLFYLTLANGLETLEVVMHRFPAISEKYTAALDDSRRGANPTALAGASSLIFLIDKYGQITEQPQRWSLFAPNVADQSCFLACELRWEGIEESVWLLSENEPSNPDSYLRFGGNRLRSIEQNLAPGFSWRAGESELDAQTRWGQQIQDKLAREYDILQAWVALRVEAFLDLHSDAPAPSEVIVHVRGYEIPAPYAKRQDRPAAPYCVALARWVPSAEPPDDYLPLEAYDPVMNVFVLQPFDLLAANAETDQ
ncbi:hypothetical protein [Lignipirellula cremea]|uniref:Uncharacterized protein n=1 Tax=Lignipirellula cremea TaxID=2528010 RepID=A0A518DLB4_9BACT|nr:hypothetical protein [Lignipirellula cremea]QDU92620.1 hypothetical protein Pla8534_03680 [Lignipirellula cremea]